MRRETASLHVMLNAGAIADITERTVTRNKRKRLPPLAILLQKPRRLDNVWLARAGTSFSMLGFSRQRM